MSNCNCTPCDYYSERAAIREHHGGQTKRAAEQGAAVETVRKFDEPLEHMQAAGTVAKQEQVGLFR